MYFSRKGGTRGQQKRKTLTLSSGNVVDCMKVFFKSRLFLCDVLSGNYNIVMQTLSEFVAGMTAISL